MIKERIQEKKYKEAYEAFIMLHPHDQAEVFVSLDVEDQVKLLSYLDDTELSFVLSYLEPSLSAFILSELSLSKQQAIFDQMEIDDAVDIIEELPLENQEAILPILQDSESMKKLLKYSDSEAGSLMTDNYIQIHASMDIKEAMKELIKMAPEAENISNLFVVDEGKYEGIVDLTRLIKAKSPLRIESLLTKAPFVYDKDEIDVSIYMMREYALYEIAVCNENQEMLGIITLDDAIEAYQEEAEEDFKMLSAVSEDEEEKNTYKKALKRLPWLIILLLASIPIALSTSMFEEVIVTFSIMALFQPLILDASGDVATQTLAVTLRHLSKQDKASFKEGAIEIITGIINGFLLGLASFLITVVIAIILESSNPFMLGVVVGLSLWLSVIIGPILGFFIPVILNKMKLDPAVASGPFITTLVDIFSLIIFFGLATLLLGV